MRKVMINVKGLLTLMLCVFTVFSAQIVTLAEPVTNSAAKAAAFPGAEGGGMYTTGGRGMPVYEVTNLNDSGPGSFRDAVSRGNRTVVFRVSGTIELKSRLGIDGTNLTIAGQTAPGDGICIKGYDTVLNGSNVIIRYIRFRPGGESGGEPDGFTTRFTKNVIMDHCSFSWGIDEVASAYGVTNFTMQWSIIGESLTMSTHQKGKHGYGGIWGGNNTTYHHNLLVSNSSRNPRLAAQDEKLGGTTIDFRNNVIYNWGYKSAYGGEKGAQINIVNNYYKYGLDTIMGVRSRIHDPIEPISKFFISGNYVYGYADVTADNWKGTSITDNAPYVGPTEPVQINQITTQTAEEAYNSVLENAGVVLPKRDAVDARIVNSVINGTGRQINDEKEAGGWPILNSAEAPADSDHDGMPDKWEKEMNLDPNNADDGKNDSDQNGYTNLEEYMNSIVGNGTENPSVKITSPKINDIFSAGKSVKIDVDASDSDGSIAKVEFFQNGVKLGEDTTKPYNLEWKNIEDGTYYLTAIAVDNSGAATQSDSVVVHANIHTGISPWKSIDIGNTMLKGAASIKDGVFTIKGAGRIEGENESFQYTYQKMKGDGEIIAKVDHITALDYDVTAGLMIREKLSPGSASAMIELANGKEMKFGLASNFISRSIEGSDSKQKTLKDVPNPGWIKLERKGDTFTGYVSADGSNWNEVASQDIKMGEYVYIGFAVDSSKNDNDIVNYNTVKFSNVNITKANKGTSIPDSRVFLWGGIFIVAAAAVVTGIILIFRRKAAVKMSN